MRLVDVRGLPRRVKRAFLTFIPLFAVGVFGTILEWRTPGLTRHGRHNPEFWRVYNLLVMAFLTLFVPWLVWMFAINMGWAGLVYGRVRRGRVRVGTKLGLLGLWWRRIDCSEVAEVEFTDGPVVPRGNHFDDYYVIVRSGGRSLSMRSFAPPTPESKIRITEWLEDNGVQVKLVATPPLDLPLVE